MNKELLGKLQEAVTKMADPNPDDVADVVDMTPEGFVAHITDHITKAAAEEGEDRMHRVGYLLEIIEIAKNFEGPTGGSMRIPMFRDRGQQTTTMKQVPAPQNASQASNYAATPAPQPAGLPSTPPGGQVPPMTAGGSGFSTPAAATFAKAMEGVEKALQELQKGDDEGAGGGEGGEETTETQTAEGGKAAASGEGNDTEGSGDDSGESTEGGDDSGEGENVEKSEDATTWPLDLNTAFGRGETEDDVEPEWGFDNPEAAAIHKAEQGKRKAS